MNKSSQGISSIRQGRLNETKFEKLPPAPLRPDKMNFWPALANHRRHHRLVRRRSESSPCSLVGFGFARLQLPGAVGFSS